MSKNIAYIFIFKNTTALLSNITYTYVLYYEYHRHDCNIHISINVGTNIYLSYE